MKNGLLTSVLLGLLAATPNSYVPTIAVEGAYAILTTTAQLQDDAKKECCKECKNKGYVVHGDGHNTECICPDTCQCKKGFAK